MSEPGFAAVCSHDGLVMELAGESELNTGDPLTLFVARDSRSRLLQLLVDSREVEQHTVLQTADGSAVDVYCASDGNRTLFVTAPTHAAVASLCDALSRQADVSALALRLVATLGPDPLSVDLWEELSRLNNDLATAQRQLARNNAELRWLNEQKNRLLGMAAHDLRNPLAAVLAYAQFLAAGSAGLSPEQQAMLERIRINADTMLKMVEDVLDFSAIESGIVRLELNDVSLKDLLLDVAETSAFAARAKSIELVILVEPDAGNLRADRRKLTQVFNNLLNNAIKFSYPGSSVKIAAGPEPGGGAWISVADQGVGMTPEQIARLFEPFVQVGVQATAGEKSTGLGLAIVRRIIAAHHGRVEVASAPGTGTTFTVVLPVGIHETAASAS